MAFTDYIFPTIAVPEPDGWAYGHALLVASTLSCVYAGVEQKGVALGGFHSGLSLWSVDDIDGIDGHPEHSGGCGQVQNRTTEWWLTLDGEQVSDIKEAEAGHNSLVSTPLGGAGDMWGSSLTKAQVFSAAFGVAFRKKTTGPGEIRISQFRLRVSFGSLL